MLNRMQLIGRLGRDPQVAMTPTGNAVAKFPVAVNRPRAKTAMDKSKPSDETQWFNVVAWDRLADASERLLHTGDLVYIEGRMNSRTYTDRDGQERTAWEITATDIQLLVNRRPPSPTEELGRADIDGHVTSNAEPHENTAHRRAAAPASSARDAEWRVR
jgi:single-strand DNA-binding protein